MATYIVQPGCLAQGAQASTTVVTFIPNMKLTDTATGSVSTYFYPNDQPTDVQLGGAGNVTKHQGKGVIK